MARHKQVISDPTLLAAALEGLVMQKDRIEEQIRQLREVLGKRSPGRPAKSAGAPAAAAEEKPRKRRKMSAAARKRIAEAQKKRWSEYRKQQKADG